MTSLLEEPLSLVSVKSTVSVSIVLLEHAGQVFGAVHTLGSQGRSKLFQDLVGLFSLHSELRPHVSAIDRALD